MSGSPTDNSVEPCWIETIDPEDAGTDLADIYRHVGAIHGKVHNLYRAFSLQPKPLIAADQHYRDILHNEKNQSLPWFLELLATQTANLANCSYAADNHGANFKTLYGDQAVAESMLEAVRNNTYDNNEFFNQKQAAFLHFGAKLARSPDTMSRDDLESLRVTGASDTEILEAVQSIACFAYWVRFINALGIQIGDEDVGMFDEDGKARGED
jgi:uncharacterized peroxidase-related enzyme